MALLGLNLLTDIGLSMSITWWASPVIDAMHSHAVRFRGGVTYFVRPWLGKYLDVADWMSFVLLAVLFAILWIYRDDVERVG